ncbi:autotransporter outer membrane beta-barrel domain-containing protein [Sphingobium sp. HWE2-09]|uniref:autotransporter outer membrane beta-barrel domain-containing protein n=1 Tax=Sphingobium sp. HWE2-09 TaxID=3108390 RepID=UPI002DCAE658|nr:autotransporter outer membrane beta-barrel domain-containing protein [Sphingobium sp. HWE2-09]
MAVDKAQIVVDAGAVVSGPGRGSIMVLPPVEADSYATATSTIIVRGTVSGANAGIVVASSQPDSYDYSYGVRTQSAIVVEQGGAIQGDVGVEVNPNGGNYSGWAWVTIDNSGTISGTSGIALRGNSSASGRFDWIRNEATGVIGAILGQVGSLDNEGLIDGGANSAISDLPDYYSYYGQGTIANGGTIRSSGTAATIFQYRSFNPGNYVENAGTIENLGTGAAIAGNTIFYLDNGATGVIRSASGAAVTAPDYLSITNAGRIESAGNAIETGGRIILTNSGTITGNVVSTTGNPYSGSVIDNRAGTIEGDVLLGDGDDVFIADSSGIGAIAGRLDAGGGVDTLRYLFEEDTTLNAGIALPASFEQIAMWVGKNSTLTLGSDFLSTSTIAVGGGDPYFYNPENRFTNQGLIDTDGQALVSDYSSTGGLTVRNEGNIRASLKNPEQFAVDLGNESYFSNAGTITAAGGNAVRFTRGYELANSGSIIADGTAVSTTIALANSGTIQSTSGMGADLSNAYQGRSSNSGLIEGRTIGARLHYSTLVNSGTIRSDGAALEFGYSGILYNEAGGVVRGGTAAVRQSSLYSGSGGSLISNAGLIQGDVDFGNGYADATSSNVFIARAGGVLDGNLNLGGGNDTLVTSFVNDGPGQFSGITGVVTGNGSENLRYIIDGSVATNVGKVGIFSRIGYDLTTGSALTLTGSTIAADTLIFAGQGSVDLTADMTGSLSDPLIRMNVASYLTDAEGQTIANAVTLVSHGTLSKTIADPYAFGAPLIAVGAGNSFENAGTLRTTGGQYYRLTTLAGGGTVINSGLIEVSRADVFNGSFYWPYDNSKLFNSGVIREAADSDGTARGIVNANVLVNNGTIDMGGTAVVYDYLVYGANLTNNGLIRSVNGAAITGSYYTVSIRNEADGVIQGGGIGAAIALGNGQISNAGTIKGDVQFGVDYYSGSGLYIADGGTIEGDLRFGGANDIFLQVGDDLGVTGTIDGGDGQDMFGRIFTRDATVMLGGRPDIGFERDYLLAQAGATVSIDASATSSDTLFVGGEGTIVNLATLDGTLSTDIRYYSSTEAFAAYLPRKLASFVNRGTLNGGFASATTSFDNQGSISVGNANSIAAVVQAGYRGDLNFANSGTIIGSAFGAVNLYGDGISAISLRNDGLIDGGVAVNAAFADDVVGRIDIDNSGVLNGPMSIITRFAGESGGNVSLKNRGTIRTNNGGAIAISNDYSAGDSSWDYRLDNSGLIETNGLGSAAVNLSLNYYNTTDTARITNSGTIRANGDGLTETYSYWGYGDFIYTTPSAAIALSGNNATTLTLSNTAGGTIEATGDLSTAILLTNAALTLDNAGTIRGGAGTVLGDSDQLALWRGNPYLAGAIQAVGFAADSVTNSGTIIGSIDLGFGDDVIVNRGTIIGDVYLRDGDDSFTQLASAILQGTVDGGAGTDSFIVDATGGGAVNGDQFVNFERFVQIGEGNVSYSGDFSFDTIGLDGGTVTVAAGETLSSASATTITGGAGNDSVKNAGTIVGGIALAGGDDSIVNGGSIGGLVAMGAGNDSFTEQAGSSVAGLIDGGTGTDLYRVILADDRSGIGAQTGFEQLSVEGQGTLTLALDQGYDLISLVGTNLTLATNGQFVGQILGSDAQAQLRLTGDASSVQLGRGNDAMIFDLTRAAGRYDGGAGNDGLTFAAQGPVTLSGAVTGFESVSLAGGALIVTGQLGSANGALRFGDVGERLEIAAGGRLLGQIDMAGGDDIVTLADGAVWQGILSGGAGNDGLILGMANARTLDANSLLGFEAITARGAAMLTLANGFTLQSLNVEGDLTLASGASLTTDSLTFGSADNRFVINGVFAGSIDGGAGSNRILLNAGSAATPVRFAAVGNITGLDMSGGYATVSGNADFGVIDLTSGRLVGLAGSTIRAGSISVRQGATFGSAGHVIGNVNVAGTLSPGASPGTMTVTGNVALAGGSTTLMEISPTLSDQLLISGTLTIAQGAGLVLTADQQVKPGTTLDLIIANGGISGSYTSIVKPDSLFGFVIQDDKRIRLLGQFLHNGTFTPQVGRAIDYTNGVIGAGTASDGLIDALPILASASGASNSAAFARLTAEPYASATQTGVENGLTIANATRSIARLSGDDAPRAFSIGQYLGGLGRIAADDQAGLSASRSRSYGLLGGLGIGTDRWSIAGFGGYLDSRQTLRQLGSQTDADGWFAGVAGSYALGALRFDATLAYHHLDADTDRLTPDGGKAHGRFRLKNWVGDLSLSYEAVLGSDWAAQPDIGLTYVATTRTGVREDNGSVWALDVAKDKHDALFADGGIAFSRSRASDAPFRPFVRLGVQYQLKGRHVEALAGLSGANQGLLSLGARRGGLVGSVSGGAEMRVSSVLSLFANAAQTYSEDDRRASANIGMKFAF